MQNMPVVRTVEKWHLLHMLWGVTVAYAECELGSHIERTKSGAILTECLRCNLDRILLVGNYERLPTVNSVIMCAENSIANYR